MGTATLEERLATVETRVARLELVTGATAATAPPPALQPPLPLPLPPSVEPPRRRDREDHRLEDLLGGRVLALVGGGAVVLAAVFFLSLAVERGWIGPAVRVGVAGAVSAALVGVGTWLHERRGRTQAAVVTAAAGVGGLLLTLVAATSGHGLLPAALTLPAAGFVGALATWLALRWDARPVAWLGIGGGLLAPPALGAPATAETLGFLVVAFAAATAVAVVRRWHGLHVGAALLVLPQVGWWAGGDAAASTVGVVLGLVGAVPFVAAITAARRARVVADATAPLLLAGAAAWWLAVLGAAGLPVPTRPWWLVAVVVATGAVLAAAVPTAVRFVRDADGGAAGITTTVAAGLLLVVGVVWSWTEPAAVHEARLAALTALTATIAGLELAVRRLLARAPTRDDDARAARPADVVDAAALLCLALVTAAAFDAWLAFGVLLAEAVALRLVAAGTGQRMAEVGAGGLWLVAALDAVGTHAPLPVLVDGLADVPATLAWFGAVLATAGGAIALGRVHRRRWAAAAAVVVGYLASTLLVTAALAAGDPQWAQVVLGGAWTLAGAVLLATGLRRGRRGLRWGGFALLGLAVSKAVLYDLSALDLGARSASFLALGLLLLAAGFGYQRRRRPVA